MHMFTGIKHEARRIVEDAGIPVVPGSNGLVKDENEAIDIAHQINFPVILKATAGGGGMGLVVCKNEEELVQGFESTSKHAKVVNLLAMLVYTVSYQFQIC